MDGRKITVKNRNRVWVVRYREATPTGWHDAPPGAVAVKPTEAPRLTAHRAKR